MPLITMQTRLSSLLFASWFLLTIAGCSEPPAVDDYVYTSPSHGDGDGTAPTAEGTGTDTVTVLPQQGDTVSGGSTSGNDSTTPSPVDTGSKDTTPVDTGSKDTTPMDTGSQDSEWGIDPPPPVTGGQSGWASRYWDCCKPHCAWSGNTNGHGVVKSCSQNGVSFVGDDDQSACSGGNAFQCYNLAPWAVGDKLAYGFTAIPGSTGDPCGRCYQLDFDGGSQHAANPGNAALKGKTMIVQAVNIGYDVSGNQFDLLIPGGGVGQFDACSRQWATSDLGAQYGGFLSVCSSGSHEQTKSCIRQKCQSVFSSNSTMRNACEWFVDWFEAANNPTFKFKEVSCPSALTSKSGLHR